MKMNISLGALLLVTTALGSTLQESISGFALIPAGTFEMGDHHGFVDPKHGSDEVPIHTVSLDSFYIGIYDVTTAQYVEFLNSALAQRLIAVRGGGVYLAGGSDLLCDTRASSPSSEVGWEGAKFSVLDRKEDHPMVCVRWHGAAVYCNWLSAQRKLPLCYDMKTWDCDFNKSGYRLPTEPEWEYAARGGQQKPYWNFPFANEADPTKANWPESQNPYRTGPLPWTTPVGFFDGQVHRKTNFNWPGTAESYQAANGANGYGLYDMAGNVWQWCTELYERNYYAYSPASNPPGPATGSPMPDGKAYRCMRGGSWFNGEYGHSRVSNRDPSYFRGPDPITHRSDPDGPYFHIGFRVVLPINAESRPAIKPTPVQEVRGQGGQQGGGMRRPRQGDRSRGSQRQGSGEGDRPPRSEEQPRKQSGSFLLRSPMVQDGGALPVEFTGDGEAATPPLEWSGAPAGTTSYALIMHHIDPKGVTKWYWVLYNIPANVKCLSKNVQGIGTLGNNSINDRTEYAPPHSKGPGTKTYILTIYALLAPPHITVQPSEVSRDVLLAAMKDKILASAELSVTYTRSGNVEGGDGADRRTGQGRRPGDSNQPDNDRRAPPSKE